MTEKPEKTWTSAHRNIIVCIAAHDIIHTRTRVKPGLVALMYDEWHIVGDKTSSGYESLVLTKESSLNWGSRVGKKFDWANLFLILCLVLCSLTWNVPVLRNMGFQTQPHARFASSHHNAKMSLHTTILAVLVFILIYSPFLLLGDHLPLEPPWLASGLGYSVPSPPCCLDLRNGHIGESWSMKN